VASVSVCVSEGSPRAEGARSRGWHPRLHRREHQSSGMSSHLSSHCSLVADLLGVTREDEPSFSLSLVGLIETLEMQWRSSIQTRLCLPDLKVYGISD